MDAAMSRDCIKVNDRQLSCARIDSQEGQDYLAGMAAAANYAWVNRSMMTFLVRQAFAKTFESTPDDLDMHVIYDVSHNIAKEEEHMVDGKPKRLLVHRKGSTRAFPPHHPLIPVDYQFTGQPIFIGGSMGTCSYVLTGTDKAMSETFGSTCHGAGRAMSRNRSRNTLTYTDVLQRLTDQVRPRTRNRPSNPEPHIMRELTHRIVQSLCASSPKSLSSCRAIAVVGEMCMFLEYVPSSVHSKIRPQCRSWIHSIHRGFLGLLEGFGLETPTNSAPEYRAYRSGSHPPSSSWRRPPSLTRT